MCQGQGFQFYVFISPHSFSWMHCFNSYEGIIASTGCRSVWRGTWQKQKSFHTWREKHLAKLQCLSSTRWQRSGDKWEPCPSLPHLRPSACSVSSPHILLLFRLDYTSTSDLWLIQTHQRCTKAKAQPNRLAGHSAVRFWGRELTAAGARQQQQQLWVTLQLFSDIFINRLKESSMQLLGR